MGAVKKHHYPRLVLDANLAQTVVQEVCTVFSKSFGIKPENEPFRLMQDFTCTGDVSGVMGMFQDEMEGTLTLSFPKKTICLILGKIYGRKIDTLDQSIREGVGEITNIVYGMMKKTLNEKGYAFRMSIPNVIMGEGHSIQPLHRGHTMVIPFRVENEVFFVDITVRTPTE